MTQCAKSKIPVFPFSAIVGQEQMKLALILIAVNPSIGGLLIRGQKGTAKSTAVRGLAELLPRVVNGNSVLTDLPLGATEDMVVGSIDFEAAVLRGETHFQPGLLARADGGLLYIDEVNLLDDHLVECILDAAETGVNIVEREGLCVRHPACFSLVGSMNPEEGELRPQLLDRFGLAVQVVGEEEVERRVELMRRRERFDRSRRGFIAEFKEQSERLNERITAARKGLAEVTAPSHLARFIAEIAASNNVAGHRADIAIERAARAHAAWHGRDQVAVEDIQAVAKLALLHRSREGAPPDLPPPPKNDSESQTDDAEEGETPPPPDEKTESGEEQKSNRDFSPDSEQDHSESPPQNQQSQGGPSEEKVWDIGRPYRVKSLVSEKDKVLRTGSGRRSRSRSANKHGRYVRSTARRRIGDFALDATLRAAAPFQSARKKARSLPLEQEGRRDVVSEREAPTELAVHIREGDIREKVRERRLGNVLIFAVDGSGSMGAQKRMVETKAAVMSVLMDAYQKRDRVSLVVFRGREATVALPPTSSVELASRLLADMPIGGRTPLSAGLCRVAELLDQIGRKDPLVRPIVILLTDGKANAALGEGPAHLEALAIAARIGEHYSNTRFIVVDTEPLGAIRLGLAHKMALALGADYFEPKGLRAHEIVDLIREST